MRNSEEMLIRWEELRDKGGGGVNTEQQVGEVKHQQVASTATGVYLPCSINFRFVFELTILFLLWLLLLLLLLLCLLFLFL